MGPAVQTGELAAPSPSRGLAVLLGVLALTVAAYLGIWSLDWTGWDDTAYVTHNPLMTAPDGLARIWTSNQSEQFYPLTFSLYWAEYRWFGAAAGGYHAVGLGLHLLCVLALWTLLRRLELTPWVARVAVGLFALHPTQVMTVAWIAEQKNTLSTLFMLLAMLAWVNSGRQPSTGPGRRWYLLSLACFFLAMLAKTVVLGLPLSLLALDHFVLGRSWKSGVLRTLPMLLIAGSLAALTLVFEQKFIDKSAAGWMPSLAERLQIAGAAPWAYLGRLAWPINLSPAYDLWPVSASVLKWWLPLAATAVVGLALLWLHHTKRLAGPGAGLWVWGPVHFIVLLGPTLGLVQFGNLAVTFTSDHFLYPASFGLFVVFAWCVQAVAQRAASGGARGVPRLAAMVSGAIIVGMAMLTRADLRVWHDAESLWTRGVAVAPNNYTAHLGLAEGLLKNKKRQEALDHYAKAAALHPDWVDAYMLWGDAQRDLGDGPGAEATYLRALQVSPENTHVLTNLAQLLERRGDHAGAQARYERLIAMDTSDVGARLGLARVLTAQGQFEAALQAYDTLGRGGARSPQIYIGVATCLQRLNRSPDAAEAVDAGLQLFPDDLGLLILGSRLRSIARDESVRDLAKARSLADRAVQLTQGRHAISLDTLAAVLAGQGQLDEAQKLLAQAATIARAAGDEAGATKYESNAKHYASGKKPWED